MKKKYLYNGQIYTQDQMEEAASASGIPLNKYISEVGAKAVDDSYEYDGKPFSAEQVLEASKESKLSFDDYLSSANIKKKEEASSPAILDAGSKAGSASAPIASTPANIGSSAANTANEFVKNQKLRFDPGTNSFWEKDYPQVNVPGYDKPIQVNPNYVPDGYAKTPEGAKQYAAVLQEKLNSTFNSNDPNSKKAFEDAFNEARKLSVVSTLDESRASLNKMDIAGISKFIPAFTGVPTDNDLEILKQKKIKLSSELGALSPEGGAERALKNVQDLSTLNYYIDKMSRAIPDEVVEQKTQTVVGADTRSTLQKILSVKDPIYYGGINKEDLGDEFFTGLDALKRRDKVTYDNIVNRLNKNKGLASVEVAQLVNDGAEIINTRNAQKLRDNQITMDEYSNLSDKTAQKVNDNFYKRPDILQRSVANVIGKYYEKNGGVVVGKWFVSDKEIDAVPQTVFAAAGIDPTRPEVKAAIQKIKDNEGILPFDNAVQKDDLVREVVKGFGQPLTGTLQTLQGLTSTDEQKILERKLEPISGYAAQRGDYFNRNYGMLADMFNGAGQFVSQYLLMEAGIGAFRGAGMALGGSEAATLVSTPEAAGVTAIRKGDALGNLLIDNSHRLGMLAIPFIQSYDSYYKTALERTNNPIAAKAMAFTNATMESLSEQMFDNVEFAHEVAHNFSGALSPSRIAKIFDKGVLNAATTADFKKTIAQTLKNSINIVGESFKGTVKEAAEEIVPAFSDYITTAIANPDAVKNRDVLNEMKDAFVSGFVSFSLPGVIGAGGNLRKQFTKSSTENFALTAAAMNRGLVMDALSKLHDDGVISQDEFNHKAQVLNTASKSLENIPKKYTDGEPMSQTDMNDYLANTVRIKFLRQDIEHSEDEAVKKAHQEKINNLNGLNFDILNKTANEEDGLNKRLAAATTPEEKQKIQENIDAFNNKSREANGGKIFTDFDGTVWNEKTQSLTPLGEELKTKIANGEDVTVLTARDNNTENESFIAEKLGIPQSKIILGLRPKEKAAQLVPGSTFYDNNEANLHWASKRLGVNVVNTAQTESAPPVATTVNQNISPEDADLFDRAYAKGEKNGKKASIANFLNPDNKAQSIQELKEQALATPASINEKLGGDRNLTTDLIAANGVEKVNAKIAEYESKLKQDGNSELDIQDIDNHLSLLDDALIKLDKSNNTDVTDNNTDNTTEAKTIANPALSSVENTAKALDEYRNTTKNAQGVQSSDFTNLYDSLPESYRADNNTSHSQQIANAYHDIKSKNQDELTPEEKSVISGVENIIPNEINQESAKPAEPVQNEKAKPAESKTQEAGTKTVSNKEAAQKLKGQAKQSEGVTEYDASTITDAKEEGSPVMKKVVADLKKIIPALEKLVPGIKVHVAKTDADFQKLTGQKGRGGWSEANKTMYLNLAAIGRASKNNTAFHEGTHPIMNAIHDANPELVKGMADEIRSLKLPGIDAVIKYGEQQQENVRDMETVVEFIASVANGDIAIPKDKTLLNKVVDIINKFLSAIGSPKIITAKSKVSDVIKLAKEISDVFQGRKDVTEAIKPLTNESTQKNGGVHAAEAVQSQAEARPEETAGRSTKREEIEKALRSVRDAGLLVTAGGGSAMSDAEIAAQMKLMDAMADVWKQTTGKDNFYETFVADVRPGDIASIQQRGGALFQEEVDENGWAIDTTKPVAPPVTRLTLAVFSVPQFEKMKGMMVSPQSIADLIKGRGKQIERDIINNTLSFDKYKGSKRISFDEFRNDVELQLMKLERITTNSYARYGMDNTTNRHIYGDASTIILNSPVNHGDVGHFSGDFTTTGLNGKTWELKQIPGTETWAAMDANAPAGLTAENIQDYVGTAGTKEEVEAWIKDRNDASSGGGINKGLFGHFRVWDNGDIFHIPEYQSDYFQKSKASELRGQIVPQEEIDRYMNANVWKPLHERLSNELKDKFGITTKYIEYDGRHYAVAYDKDGVFLASLEAATTPLVGYDKGEIEMQQVVVTGLGVMRAGMVHTDAISDGNSESPMVYYRNAKHDKLFEYTKIESPVKASDMVTASEFTKVDADMAFDQTKITYNEERNKLESKEFEYITKRTQELYKEGKTPNLVLEQFIASQKVHELRIIREALKYVADEGGRVARFPAPYTVAVLEGYVDQSGEGNAPYEILRGDADGLEDGDLIDYGGTEMMVLAADSSTIEVAPRDKISIVDRDDYVGEETSNRMNEIEYEAERHFSDLKAITKEELDDYEPDEWMGDEAKRLLEAEMEATMDTEGREDVNVSWNSITNDLEKYVREAYDDQSDDDLFSWADVVYRNNHGYGSTVYIVEGRGQVETFNQPDQYDSENNDEDNYYEDLSDEYKTVVDKYAEINETIKKMRPDVQSIRDDNGLEWLETKITDADRTNPIVAFQQEGARVKAAIDFANENKATVHIFDRADISSLAHEMSGHLGRRVLENLAKVDKSFAKDYETAKQWAGAVDGWSSTSEEKFARGFEKYLREGKSPTAELQSVFSQLKNWLSKIYQKIKGSSIDIKLTAEIRKVFDNLLAAKKETVTGEDGVLPVTEPVKGVQFQSEEFSKDPILNNFLTKLNKKGQLQVNPFDRGTLVYDNKAALQFSRFDKKDRKEIGLDSISVFDKGAKVGTQVMQDITRTADELGITLTLDAKPFGNDPKGLNKKALIDFYKKNGFTTDDGQYGLKAAAAEKYVLKQASETLAMTRKPYPGVQFQTEVVNGFYSPLEKIINDTKYETLPAKQWMDKFAGGEEAKWTGLREWLSKQTGSISKGAIRDFLKENRIQVREIHKDDNVGKYQEQIDRAIEEKVKIEKQAKVYTDKGLDAPQKLIDRQVAIGDRINELISLNYKPETKYGAYQLEGGSENYKEILVTLPSTTQTQEGYKYYNKKGELEGESMSEATVKRWVSENGGSYVPDIKVGQDFKSSHFDEPNILVHLRMNTRTDANGNKVLFLEEVQSDWGQKGKKEGFSLKKVSPEDIKLITDEQKYYDDEEGDYRHYVTFKVKGFPDTDGVSYYPKKESKKQLIERLAKVYTENMVSQTAAAPFVMNTNSWVKLGLKVALKEAVRQGVDKIAWTTGEQQNARYDLSKVVKEIRYMKLPEVSDTPNRYYLSTDGQVISGTYDESQLEGVVGKEIAAKIIERANDNMQSLSGVDLQVGGKGMKGFYGEPSENKLGIIGEVAKSLTGQEPGTTSIVQEKAANTVVIRNTEDIKKYSKSGYTIYDQKGEAISKQKAFELIETGDTVLTATAPSLSQQHSIEITPQITAEVNKGLPQFQTEEELGIPEDVYDESINVIANELENNENTPVTEAINKGIEHIESQGYDSLNKAKYINKILGIIYGVEDAADYYNGLSDEQKAEYDAAVKTSRSKKSNSNLSVRERIERVEPEVTGDRTNYSAAETFKNAGYGQRGRTAQGETTTISRIVSAYLNFIHQFNEEHGGDGISRLMDYLGYEKNRRKSVKDIDTTDIRTNKHFSLVNVMYGYLQNTSPTELGLTPSELVSYSKYLKKLSFSIGRSIGQDLNTAKLRNVTESLVHDMVLDSLYTADEQNAFDEFDKEMTSIVDGEQDFTDEELTAGEILGSETELEKQAKQSEMLSKAVRLSEQLENLKSEPISDKKSKNIADRIKIVEEKLRDLINKIPCD